MKQPVVLYSIQTYLAYCINNEYYKGVHYVWAAPHFDADMVSMDDLKAAPTSNPKNIFNSLNKEAYVKDRHLDRVAIKSNIRGLLLGVEAKKASGVITEDQAEIIRGLIKCIKKKKEYDCFRPVIYVIPFKKVKNRVERVPYNETALSLSPEYRIADLKEDEFDKIYLSREGLIL